MRAVASRPEPGCARSCTGKNRVDTTDVLTRDCMSRIYSAKFPLAAMAWNLCRADDGYQDSGSFRNTCNDFRRRGRAGGACFADRGGKSQGGARRCGRGISCRDGRSGRADLRALRPHAAGYRKRRARACLRVGQHGASPRPCRTGSRRARGAVRAQQALRAGAAGARAFDRDDPRCDAGGGDGAWNLHAGCRPVG